MWKPARLKIENFQSFALEEYEFCQGRALSIEGENLTDEGQKSNGSGKSSFTDAIYYLLLGTSSTGRRDSELVRKGEKEASLYLSLEEDSIGRTMEIRRSIYSNSKSASVSVLIDGEDARDRYSSVLEANRLILDEIGLGAEDIRSYFLINRERFVSFFDSPDSSKRALLARFSSVGRLERLQERLAEELKEEEAEMGRLEIEKSRKDAVIGALEGQLEGMAPPDIRAMKEDLQKGIENLELQCAELDAQIGREREAADGAEASASVYGRAARRLSLLNYAGEREGLLDRISQMKQAARQKMDEADALKGEAASLKEDMSSLKVAVGGAVVCPKCSHEFSPSSSIDISEARALIAETEAEISRIEAEASRYVHESYSISGSKERLSLEESVKASQKREAERDGRKAEYEREAKSLSAGARSALERVRMGEASLHALQVRAAELQARLSSIDEGGADESYRAARQSILDRIGNEKAGLKELEEREKALAKGIERGRIWTERLQQFYIYLTNTALKAIENRCNVFLGKMGSSLCISLEGFKVLASGKIRDSVSALISRGAGVQSTFRCFSGGERGRLVFSTILALQDMVNQEAERGLDLLVIDEVLDQVDSSGMESFLKTLSGLGRTIFLTSQIRTDAPSSDVLLIRKENGISRIAR